VQIAARRTVKVTKIVSVSTATRLQQKAEIDTFSKPADPGAGRVVVDDVEPVAVEIEEGDVVKFVREIRMYDDED
jgi:hypothetical protein